MKKTSKKRLALSKQSIRILATFETIGVAGGAPATPNCTHTCSCTDDPIISCCP